MSTFERIDLAAYENPDRNWGDRRYISITVEYLKRCYAEIDRLQSQLIAVQEDAMTIYGDNDRLTAEIDRLRAELSDAWMESGHDKATIDRLRDTPPEWTTITDDARSYPKSGARVVLQIGNGTSDGVVARRDAIVDYAAKDGAHVTEVETWFMERTGNQLSIRPGDRWSYIPEAPDADN